MPTWPASLPQSLDGPIQKRRDSGMIRSDMDTGPAKQRRRFTAVVKYYSGSMLMTGDQVATFEAFYSDELGEGALSFDGLENPETGSTTGSMRFREDPEFTSVHGAANAGDRLWRVNMEIEVLPS